MDRAQMIEALCRLPVEFRQRRTESEPDLLEECGYSRCHTEVPVDEIERYLSVHRQLIKAWLEHSEIQRCVLSWHFLSPDAPFTKVPA